MSMTYQEGAQAMAAAIVSRPNAERYVSSLPFEVRVTIALLLAACLEARGELPTLQETPT